MIATFPKPRTRRLRPAALLAGALVGLIAIQAAAIHREDERYVRKRVEPGELVSRTLGCRTGELTGGGYLILGQPEDRVIYNVTANFPLADGRWRVDLRNTSGARQELNLMIYALCTDE